MYKKASLTKQITIGNSGIKEIEPLENKKITFDNFFDIYIKENLRLYDKKRNAFVILFIDAIVLTIATLTYCILTHKEIFLVMWVPACIIALLMPRYIFKNSVNTELFPLIISFLGRFKPERTIEHDKSYFNNVIMFPKYTQNPIINDYFIGSYKGSDVEIEEIKLTTATETNKKFKLQTLFDGVLITFSTTQKEDLTLIIKNKELDTLVNKGEVVNSDENKILTPYEITSNKPDEANKILTENLINQLKEVNKLNLKIAICYKQGLVYIAIKDKPELHNLPFFKSFVEIPLYKKIAKQYETIFLIIDLLNNKIIK